jgi:hypothetical protein
VIRRVRVVLAEDEAIIRLDLKEILEEAQNAIHQFRELCAQTVEYAFEERGLDILGGLMQQRVGEFQGLREDCRVYRLGVRGQDRHARLGRFGENRNIARVVLVGFHGQIKSLLYRRVDASPAPP